MARFSYLDRQQQERSSVRESGVVAIPLLARACLFELDIARATFEADPSLHVLVEIFWSFDNGATWPVRDLYIAEGRLLTAEDGAPGINSHDVPLRATHVRISAMPNKRVAVGVAGDFV